MSTSAKRKNNSLLAMLIAGIIIVAMVAVFIGVRHSRLAMPAKTQASRIDGSVLPMPKTIKPFHLSLTSGKPFDNASLKGHWSMVFFGYTNCAVVCPTTMAELTKMYAQLQKALPANQLPQVILVTVDPERDSLSRLNAYVKAFNPAFVGARGDLAHLKELSQQLNIVFKKIVLDENDSKHYKVTHSAEVLLINPEGDLTAFLAYPHAAKQMVHDYETIIQS